MEETGVTTVNNQELDQELQREENHPPSPPPPQEYKALRDEMIHLFNRVFVVLGAEIAAFAALETKSLGESSLSPSLMLLLLNQVIIIPGILLTIAFYSNLYSIGSYIAYYWEKATPFWHVRSRIMRIKLADQELGAPIGYFEKINEPKTMMTVYMLLSIALLLTATYKVLNSDFYTTKEVFFILSAIMIFFVIHLALLVSVLKDLYDKGARNWIKRWKAYDEQHKDKKIDYLIS